MYMMAVGPSWKFLTILTFAVQTSTSSMGFVKHAQVAQRSHLEMILSAATRVACAWLIIMCPTANASLAQDKRRTTRETTR
jgi:hypothetical protein